jgi:DNA-3-methyladenine glycosylase
MTANESARAGAVLLPSFFDRPAQSLARELIGATLVRRFGLSEGRFAITETEAYLGPHDLACHSARGRTPRTEVMFGQPGNFYIYRVYGLHLMLNIVAGPRGAGAAVLIRSAGAICGPGRLGKALALSMDLNGMMAAPASGLWLEKGLSGSLKMTATPRIGIEYAGARWARRKLRFVATGGPQAFGRLRGAAHQ